MGASEGTRTARHRAASWTGILALLVSSAGIVQLTTVAPASANTLPTTVTGVSPNSGPTAGGTNVTITGTNLTSATGYFVYFGNSQGTNMVVVSSTSITVTSPAESPGVVDVRVVSSLGESATSSADQFTYIAPVTSAPTVTAVSPNSGTTAGGTTVTITGTNFTGATVVAFGASTGVSFAIVSSTTISATSPVGSAGPVDITVTTPSGTSGTSSADQFTFVVLAPTVASISPTSGTTAGGTSVTITGTNFTGATAVDFGPSSATTFTVNSPTSITVTSPAESAGPISNINASMMSAPGETISGTVTSSSGTGISGICVTAIPASTSSMGFAPPSSQTSSSGSYSIGGLAAGSYDVEFWNCTNGSLNYQTQWYSTSSPGTTSQASATAITVGTTPVSGINASMAPGETISGTVTSSSGTGISGICVTAIPASTSSMGFAPPSSQTSSSGSYSIGGLAAGSYYVEFSNCSNGSLNYQTQWYSTSSPGTTSQASATAITVGTTPVSGINASM
ncbi:MAG: IPT/TIG domain-containing protein, partial [Actinomycetota bacterium]|nr:IPT/TIG domain-containing protein [Actinomycetota bacterium]